MTPGIWTSPHSFQKISARRNMSEEIATLAAATGLEGTLWLPDPDPVLRKIGKDLAVYRRLLADQRVGPVAESRTGAITSMEWWLDPEIGSRSARTAVQSMLHEDVDLEHVLEWAATAPLFGCAPLEIVWRPLKRRLAPCKIEGKPMEWFLFDLDGEIRFRSLNHPQGLTLPPRKFLLPRYQASSDNPYGQRVLSRCFWPVVFKRGGLQFWMQFLEKFSQPHVIGRLPRGTAKQEFEDLLAALETLVQDAIAVLPDDASVEFREAAKGVTHQLFKGLKDDCDNDITIAIAGQNLTTEVKQGSRAAAQVHYEIRTDLRDRDKKLVTRCVNTLIRWFCEFNSIAPPYPQFAFYEEDDVDQELANRDQTLHNQGVRFSRDYYIKAYGFDEDDIVAVADANEVGSSGAPPSAPPSGFAEAGQEQYPPEQLARALLPEQLQQQADALVAPLLERLARGLEQGLELEQAQELLLEAYPELPTEHLQRYLARAIFLADVLGRSDAGRNPGAPNA